jgi:hypothetical protein
LLRLPGLWTTCHQAAIGAGWQFQKETTMAFIQLSYFEWEEQFRPITKPGTDHIAFDTHDDVAFLKQQTADRIWTLVDCPEINDCVILNGIHWVNRLEYYVTEVPFNEADDYNVGD